MKRLNIKKIVSIFFTFALAMNLVACGDETTVAENNDNTEEEEVVIRVADFTGGGCIWNDQFIIALQTGIYDELFKDDNVRFEVTQFANGPAVNEAFLAGEVDFVNGIGDQPLVIGIGNGVESTILTQTSSQGNNQGIIAKSGSGITSVEDLKGKKIAVGIGTFTHKSLLGVLSDAGIEEDEVELVNLTSASDVEAAFENGDIDASVGNAYQIKTKVATGDYIQVANFENHPLFAYIVGATSFIEQYPEYTQKFIQGLYDAEQWINENPESAYEIIAEYADMDVDQVKIILENANTTTKFTDDTRNNLLVTYDFLKAHDLISTDISEEEIDEHIDKSYIDTVWQ